MLGHLAFVVFAQLDLVNQDVLDQWLTFVFRIHAEMVELAVQLIISFIGVHVHLEKQAEIVNRTCDRVVVY